MFSAVEKGSFCEYVLPQHLFLHSALQDISISERVSSFNSCLAIWPAFRVVLIFGISFNWFEEKPHAWHLYPSALCLAPCAWHKENGVVRRLAGNKCTPAEMLFNCAPYHLVGKTLRHAYLTDSPCCR